jgi:hypothetical protein
VMNSKVLLRITKEKKKLKKISALILVCTHPYFIVNLHNKMIILSFVITTNKVKIKGKIIFFHEIYLILLKWLGVY